jgi:glucose-6-phosphate isomerase
MGKLTQSPAWQDLLRHKEKMAKTQLAEIVLGDAKRLEACEITAGGVRLNYALNHVMPETIGLLVKLAEQQKLADWRKKLFAGEKINVSEKRAVLHTALRQQDDRPVIVDDRDVIPAVRMAQKRIKAFAEDIRSGKWKSAAGKPIKHVVNIGIGGSDLGPRLAVHALEPFADGPKTHFAANADAFDIVSILKNLDPAETLFVVVSKTFTTQETLLNARTARKWLTEKLGDAAVAKHFVAVSVNAAETGKFGIDPDNMFPMWDWVGGRFSLWSAVGLSLVLAIGPANFDKLLAGAAAMDRHFYDAPFAQNMPVLLALLGIWNRNFLGSFAQAVLPYCERLRDFPRYLQQLEMESNGKSVTRDGETADYATAPVIFGDCGTVGQHSFHQCLHQGRDIIPADFIAASSDDLGKPDHQAALLANMAAQGAAFAFGQLKASSPNDVYPGDRPSNFILLDKLDPKNFGSLLALYEHKTFVQGVVWNINSFDQPGVELGKKMAKALESDSGTGGPEGTFTAKLFGKIRYS